MSARSQFNKITIYTNLCSFSAGFKSVNERCNRTRNFIIKDAVVGISIKGHVEDTHSELAASIVNAAGQLAAATFRGWCD